MPVEIDKELFLFINSLNSPFWDQVMYVISGRLTWVPLYIAILIALGKKYRRKMIILVIVLAIGIALSDQLSVLIKNVVQRPRPCHEPALAGLVHTVKGDCGGLYGFVSSHAMNTFAAAIFSISLIRKRWFTFCMISWALIVGYSRIYLGVHYPGDVLFGSLLGIISGWAIFKVYDTLERNFLTRSHYFSPPQTDRELNV